MKRKIDFALSKKIKRICLIFITICLAFNISFLYAQGSEEDGVVITSADAFASIQSWISSAYDTITSLDIPSGNYATIEQAPVVDSTSADLVMPSSSMASMTIPADNSSSIITDPGVVVTEPIVQSESTITYGRDGLPDRLEIPDSESYRIRTPAPATPIDVIESAHPAPNVDALTTPPLREYPLAQAIIPSPPDRLPEPTVASQIPSAYATSPDVAGLASQPVNTRTEELQPRSVPNVDMTSRVSLSDVAYGPGFNTMRSSSELYYFNRMIQKLPEAERAKLREHITYTGPAVNSMAEHLPVSTRTHLGIPVDQNRLTREKHSNLYIDRDTTNQVVSAWQKRENIDYRDNQDRWNTYNGYNN